MLALIQTHVQNAVHGSDEKLDRGTSGVSVGRGGVHHAPSDIRTPVQEEAVSPSRARRSITKDSSVFSQTVQTHFKNIVAYIEAKKLDDPKWQEVVYD